jgi:TM2 domain-containing membrane protein YozV
MISNVVVVLLGFERSSAMAENTSGSAAMMSLIIPGTGQIYNGRYLVGVIWMLLTMLLWRSGGAAGLICHLCSAYTAYRYSEK